MASRRSISWFCALQSLRADREQTSPGERRIRLQAAAFAKLAFHRAQAAASVCPMVVSGAYDRQAIMRLAAVAAKARRTATGETWRICISAALQGTWAAAKALHRFLEQQQSYCVASTDKMAVRVRPRSTSPAARLDHSLQAVDVSSKQSPRMALSRKSLPRPILLERVPEATFRAGPLPRA